MTYAAQLIDNVKKVRGFKTYRAMAEELEIHETTLSQWRKGVGSPMPEARVLQLCEMAHIADVGPWLAGIHADGVTSKEARTAWKTVLDRVRPAVATVGTIAVALLVASFLPSNQGENVAAFAMLNVYLPIHYAKLKTWPYGA